MIKFRVERTPRRSAAYDRALSIGDEVWATVRGDGSVWVDSEGEVPLYRASGRGFLAYVDPEVLQAPASPPPTDGPKVEVVTAPGNSTTTIVRNAAGDVISEETVTAEGEKTVVLRLTEGEARMVRGLLGDTSDCMSPGSHALWLALSRAL